MKPLVATASVGLLAITGMSAFASPAQDKEAARKGESVPSLKAGDRAPLLRVTRWLRGNEVKTFEPGKVYVVEFWATWCGPCIAFMPHLAELQAQYWDQGVTIIGYSAAGPHNGEDKVSAFVKQRAKLKYTFAYGDDRTTYDAWMTAAGREGIPCSFVVDKSGRIAFIGHSMFLDIVLPKVVAGTLDARAISDEVERILVEYREIFGSVARDPKAGLQAVKAFEAKYPQLTDFFPSVRAKLRYLPKYGQAGEAKAYADALTARAVKRGDRLSLAMVSQILRSGDGKESKELLAVAVKAAEAIVRLDETPDALALIELAEAYFAVGDRAKATEYAGKAVEATAGEPAELRRPIEKRATELGSEKKPGDPNSKKPVPSLKVGDPAPALKVSKWLQGDAVTKFEPGKVYVVEFWATSCGALHGFMPYLTGLQARYKDQGVTIIAFTSLGIRGWPGNTEEEVATFVREQRPRPGYTFAYANDSTTADAWLEAAAQKGFCTFVVDKAGRIAYMGHPMFLGMGTKGTQLESADSSCVPFARPRRDARRTACGSRRSPFARPAAILSPPRRVLAEYCWTWESHFQWVRHNPPKAIPWPPDLGTTSYFIGNNARNSGKSRSAARSESCFM
jgi:thiol-disulfide isomerase/thioredoxin